MAVNQAKWNVVKGKNENKDKVVGIHGVDDCKPFKFEVIRQKDNETKQENLVIYASYNDEDYGKIICSISKIQSDILELKNVGIVLMRQNYVELAKTIEQHFYELPLEKVEYIGNGVPKEELLKFVRHFKTYIKENKIEKKDRCYNIEVSEFSKEYGNNMFKYEEREYREALRIYGYTKCNGTSFTHVVKLDDKKGVKCISFWADKIDEIAEE